MTDIGSKRIFPDKDILIAIGTSLVIFLLIRSVDTFEGLYAFTRAYENLELDELLLFLLSTPLPVAWLAYRRSNKAEREFRRRIALEKSLAHRHRLESLGTLASGVAHELNNQLLPVITMAELLRDTTDKADPNHRKLELIFSAVSGAKNTVSKILTFSSTMENDDEICDVAAVCRDAQDILTIGCPAGVSFLMHMDKELGHIAISAHDLQSILVNPVINAFDAAESGGDVQVSINTVNPRNSLLPPELSERSYICIRIRDNGPGMEPNVRDRIFEPFFTTKPVGSGVGMGMSVVYGLVKGAKGYLVVDSNLGQGSDVSIYLPQAKHKIDSTHPQQTVSAAEITE